MLRNAVGLPPHLTEAQVKSLQSKQIDLDEDDPERLLNLAASSYLESDGYAAVFYFKRALETRKLQAILEKFTQLSIYRIENAEKYTNSIGIMVMKLADSGNFEKSGILVGDILVSADGQVVNEPLDIASALAKASEDFVLLTVVRDGQRMIIKANGREPAGALLTQLIILNDVQL